MAFRSVEHCFTATARSAGLGGVPAIAQAGIVKAAVTQTYTSFRISRLLSGVGRDDPSRGGNLRCAGESLDRFNPAAPSGAHRNSPLRRVQKPVGGPDDRQRG